MSLSQLAGCNRLHENEERLARWLLMAQDRTQSDTLNFTQEFLAMMLGARRTTVTLIAGVLQREGLIRYQRGRVTDPESRASGGGVVRLLQDYEGAVRTACTARLVPEAAEMSHAAEGHVPRATEGQGALGAGAGGEGAAERPSGQDGAKDGVGRGKDAKARSLGRTAGKAAKARNAAGKDGRRRNGGENV